MVTLSEGLALLGLVTVLYTSADTFSDSVPDGKQCYLFWAYVTKMLQKCYKNVTKML